MVLNACFEIFQVQGSLPLFLKIRPFQNQVLKTELQKVLVAFVSVGLSFSFSINPLGFV